MAAFSGMLPGDLSCTATYLLFIRKQHILQVVVFKQVALRHQLMVCNTSVLLDAAFLSWCKPHTAMKCDSS